MPIKESTSERVPEIVASQESFSIEELFPDLNEVDMETLALLPLHLQRQVLQAIEARKVAMRLINWLYATNAKNNFSEKK